MRMPAKRLWEANVQEKKEKEITADMEHDSGRGVEEENIVHQKDRE